ncbi:uncharacterized protein [Paramormyrops kingsleyae]|uniref:uncharacterized protein isoform X1 n=1 Tax=Paramormyrops kingsleyae TaxID=1676925 RepID=UPI003B96F06B
METTSRREFVQKSGERQEQKQMPVSLKLEGERQFVTTHQEEYKPHPHVEAAAARKQRAAPRAEPTQAPIPMEHLTKYRCDFRQRDCKPQRRSPAMQHPDNLGINLALRSDFRTVQMDSYPGWDASEHLRPEPAKLKEELVVNGDAEFQGDTVTKLDFQRLPLVSARQQPIKTRGSNLDLLQGPFNGQTSNRDFFRDWGVKTRVRHGDLYDTGHAKPVVRAFSVNAEAIFSISFQPAVLIRFDMKCLMTVYSTKVWTHLPLIHLSLFSLLFMI